MCVLVELVKCVCRTEQPRVRQLQASDLPESSPAVPESRPGAVRTSRITRPAPARPTTATMYIPTEDEIDRLAKIGMYAVESLGLVSPAAATDGCHPIFS